jgi:hypothetical protein
MFWGVRKSTKSLCHGSRNSGPDSNQSSPEYKAEAVSLEPPYSVHGVMTQKTAVSTKARVRVCF